MIRYQWCATSTRFFLFLFLTLAVTIVTVEHADARLSLRAAVELVWAAMVLGLVFLLAINSTEIRTSRENVLVPVHADRRTAEPYLSTFPNRQRPPLGFISVKSFATGWDYNWPAARRAFAELIWGVTAAQRIGA